MNFNLSDSKKKLALAGVVCGLVAAALAYFGNPANMAICIACFVRDTAGALLTLCSMHVLRSLASFSEPLRSRLPQKSTVPQPDLHL